MEPQGAMKWGHYYNVSDAKAAGWMHRKALKSLVYST